MKFVSTLTLAVALCASATAASVKLTPAIADLKNLDHHEAVSWGFSLTGLNLEPGWAITGATITIKNITNWDNNKNSLFINLIDNPTNGLKFYADNTKDDVISDYFKDGSYSLKPGQAITSLTTFTDTNGKNKTENFIYEFTKSQLNALTSYIASAAGSDVSYKTETYYVTEEYTVRESYRVREGGRWVTKYRDVVKTREVKKTRSVPVYTPQATVGLTFDADCHYWNDGVSFEVTTSKVPDTATSLGLFGAALAGFALLRRRRA